MDQENVNLRGRVSKLATDKANLQLVVDMMSRLNKAPGLENTIQTIMYAIAENIGGADAVIYYVVDEQIYKASLFHNLEKIKEVDDPIVAEVFHNGIPAIVEHACSDTRMRLPEFKHAWSAAYPLRAGEDLIGVFKISSLHIGVRPMETVLPLFFEFAAMCLKNEILGHNRLRQANEKLTVANAQLVKARDELQRKVLESAASLDELTQANADLEQRTSALEKANKELAQANKELESFSYSMSHDLRTPLRAIDGFSRLVVENFGPALGDEGLRFMSLVRKSTTRMAQLIDDLLAFFSLTRREASFKVVDMAALAAKVAEELRSKEPEDRRVALRVGEMPHARCDEAMIRQVFASLVGNALKFSAPRAQTVIEVGGAAGGEENVYWVKDNGVGFDMRFRNKLFGVFQRLHGVEEFEGTGIGLAIIKRIIDRHGGRVWAESKVGEGAAFHFALPRREAAPPSA